MQWSQTLDDMVALREHGCSQLPAKLVYCEWLQALLLSGQFRLASDYLRGGVLQEKIDTDTGEKSALVEHSCDTRRSYPVCATSLPDDSILNAPSLRVCARLPVPSGWPRS
jgi:hypothetical protein